MEMLRIGVGLSEDEGVRSHCRCGGLAGDEGLVVSAPLRCQECSQRPAGYQASQSIIIALAVQWLALPGCCAVLCCSVLCSGRPPQAAVLCCAPQGSSPDAGHRHSTCCHPSQRTTLCLSNQSINPSINRITRLNENVSLPRPCLYPSADDA